MIGAGWGRTGTTSLAAALDRLGAGPVLQMQETWPHPELAELWVRHLDGERIDWPAELRGWNATADWPGCWQWQEFAALWPQAPVILSVRDPDEWYESVLASIHLWTTPGTDFGPPPVIELLARLWEVDFGGWDRVAADRAGTIDRFRWHNQSVRENCPPDRLIEWTVADGWGPIAGALGVPVPDESFPHLNRRPS
ncbi:sulfotransferase family protein [Actinoplanes sp. Pm04-4]|uniref:Sulfotransferase family protein n=1 Tax=Paractinoplanes pyxinae TaxID=2997416 RepID=A0ABT4B194_9ACTN|nr:sulfotransferase family protein [Actinoplanes pyxinae]MCY1139660.1 sulfotransferase family protein [Actinoplanes pyxinae]